MEQTNQLVVDATMTSLEIAEVAGKQHRHVLEAIRKMEAAWEKVRGSKFRLSQYEQKLPTGGVKQVPCYQLTKTECLYIATKFNDEARARLILRWEELEKERMTPVLVAEQNAATVEILDRLNTALNDARETIDDKERTIERQKRTLDEKSRTIEELHRLASILDPDHSSFPAKSDYAFITDCMMRILNLELIKVERIERMDKRIADLENEVNELSRSVKFERRIAKAEMKNESKEGGAL